MKRKNIIALFTMIAMCSTLLLGCSNKEQVKTEVDNKTTTEVTESIVENTETTEILVENTETTEIIGENTETTENVEKSETVESTEVVVIDTEVGDTTLGISFSTVFAVSENTTCEAVAEELCNAGLTEMNLVTMEVTPGFVTGFDEEITHFTKGTQFAPMIGSIPFVGYIFETDNVDTLIQELQDNANLDWNICTSADDIVITSKGNLVFFLMCSNN